MLTTVNINDMLLSLGITDPSCQWRTRRLNRALRLFYSQTTGLNRNRVAQSFNLSEHTDITTTYPMYKIWGFFAFGRTKNMVPIDSAKGFAKGRLAYRRIFGDMHLDTYRVDGPTQMTVSSSDGSDAKDAFLNYSRGPLEITNDDETFDIDIRNLAGLELHLLKIYAEKDRDFNTAQYYEQQFINWLATELDHERDAPHFVGSDFWTA